MEKEILKGQKNAAKEDAKKENDFKAVKRLLDDTDSDEEREKEAEKAKEAAKEAEEKKEESEITPASTSTTEESDKTEPQDDQQQIKEGNAEEDS